jgi:hypothetical protein
MWDFCTAKIDNDNQNRCDRAQIQREEVVYSHDVNCNIAEAENCLQA